jgi:hypothetical protein
MRHGTHQPRLHASLPVASRGSLGAAAWVVNAVGERASPLEDGLEFGKGHQVVEYQVGSQPKGTSELVLQKDCENGSRSAET